MTIDSSETNKTLLELANVGFSTSVLVKGILLAFVFGGSS
jgi:hypothetical protein